MTRKIVFVIVEGLSDQTALELILKRLFNEKAVYLNVTYGDITSLSGIKSENIINKVGDIVINWAKNNHFVKDDFLEVVQIVDLDGAYADDNLVVEDPDVQKIFYSENEIRCNYPDKIRSRNSGKRANIDRLYLTGKIWGKIPYRVYYMSANLDHVLYNKLNLSDEEKEEEANEFSDKYKDCLQDFLTFMCDSEFSVTSDYKDSWKFIEEENRSLQRYTNLSIWLKQNVVDDLEKTG